MRGVAIPLILGPAFIVLSEGDPAFMLLGLVLLMSGLIFAAFDVVTRGRPQENPGPAIPHPGLVLVGSLIAFAVAAVMVLVLVDSTTGHGGPSYSNAGPGIALATLALFGIALGVVGLARRPR